MGAILYEFVNRGGPFAYFSFTCVVGIIFSYLIYRKKNQNENENLLRPTN